MIINQNEYGDFYSGYISYSNGIPLKHLFLSGIQEVELLLKNISEEEALFYYDEGKWSVKEVFGHLVDTERIFSYRALAIARGETGLPGYDQDLYVKQANFNRYSVENLWDLYQSNRMATKNLFGLFSDEELLKKGMVNNSECTVRSLGYIITGHELHHLRILSERYFPNIDGG